MHLFGTALALVLCAAFSAATIQCISQNNAKVDWWAMVKFPHISSSKNVNVAAGYGYAYIDSTGSHLVFPTTGLNSSASPLEATLTQLYSSYDATKNGVAMFNDEWPDGKTSTQFAHSKGVMFFDSKSGFYLVHSVPRFPAYIKDGYHGYPLNEIVYGQSFLCLSLATAEFDVLGLLMQRSGPYFYETNLPPSMNALLPNFLAAIGGHFNTTPGYTIETVKTIAGTSFLGMYKNKEWGKTFYENLVAPTLEAGLRCETWMNGVGPLPSYCTPAYPWDVLNVRSLSATDSNGVAVPWKETQDHSKWAVTIGKTIACIGGINRMLSQEGRGGGTFCLESAPLWGALNGLIVTADTCPSPPARAPL